VLQEAVPECVKRIYHGKTYYPCHYMHGNGLYAYESNFFDVIENFVPKKKRSE